LDVSQVWNPTKSHEVDHYSLPNLELGLLIKNKMYKGINPYSMYLCMSSIKMHVKYAKIKHTKTNMQTVKQAKLSPTKQGVL